MSFTWAIHQGYNDLVISEGNILPVSGQEEVKQHVLISLRHYWQEYFLDIPGGVPWYELILGSKNLKQAETILRGEVLQVPGVVGIVLFSLVFSATVKRKVDIAMKLEVEGQSGPTIVDITTSMIMQ